MEQQDLKKIKELGGVTIIQNPKKIEFKTIPQKFIDTYEADYAIEPENIPSELLQIQKKYNSNYAYDEEESISKNENEKCLTKISSGGAMLLRGISGYCPVYDVVDHLKNDKASNVNIRLSNVINKPVSEVYAFWRELENLPKFMNHLKSVTTINSTLSEWTAKGPGGIGTITWKAEIVKDEKERLLSWQSLPESTIQNAGKVVFRPKGQTTEMDITISYHAPLGIAGEATAKFLNPYFEKLIKDDIENFKTYIESIH